MLYKEFKDAAKRHLDTCSYMLNNLKLLKGKQPERDVLINVYYLGGYVMECIVKYGIYASVDYSSNRDIKQLNKDEHGLTYKTDIQHHNFRGLIKDQLSPKIKHKDILKELFFLKRRKGTDNDVIDLYERWGPEIRYTYKGKKVDKKLIFEFINNVDKAYTIIKRAVGG